MKTVRVSVKQLRSVTERLLTHLEQQLGDEVILSEDYYWIVAPEERYDPRIVPTLSMIGSLVDEWEELQRVAHGEADCLVYKLTWLGSVLQCLGETLSETRHDIKE